MAVGRVFLVGIVAAGCGSDVRPMPGATQESSDLAPLIGRTWSIGAGEYTAYRCARFTVPEDMYITSIRADAPDGTHHTVLSIAGEKGTAGPDGDQDDCGVATIGMSMLYASGLGTPPLDFPDGVGLFVAAGTQLHLNLHLSNQSDAPLTGETQILVESQQDAPAQLAEMVFAGAYNFEVPPSGQPVDVSGGCRAPADYSVFAVWPHMHELAVHQKVELLQGGSGRMLHDEAFDVLEQRFYMKSPVVDVKQGDELRVTCTFVNTTGQPVRWGDAENQEMCFAGLYRFPALDEGVFRCTDNPSP